MSESESPPGAKKLKITESSAMDTSSIETTCSHFVKRKKRFCKMTVSKGKRYCGEHDPTDLDKEEENPKGRITCPLDPKHTVYRWKLQKHLKICNARQPTETPSYVVRSINSGCEPTNNSTDDSFSTLKIADINDGELDQIVLSVSELYERYVQGQIEEMFCNHSALDEELADKKYGDTARKHLVQTSSLLGILEQKEQIHNDTSFIEFGAGKGQLAFHLAQIIQTKCNSQIILLDRMSLRHKKDNKIEDRSLVHRIRVDIADFCINKLELLQKSKRVVAVSKHLCGAATDLTLRCVTQQGSATMEAASTEAILIALCCHHRCEWKSFVGKEFFISNGLGKKEFIIITKMASWAICGSGISRERRKMLEESTHNIPAEELDTSTTKRFDIKQRETIGLKCKRVLDYSRLEFLKSHHYLASLKYYVSSDITLENVCLFASRYEK